MERLWPEGIHSYGGVWGLVSVLLLHPTFVAVTAVAWSVPIFAGMSAWAAMKSRRGT